LTHAERYLELALRLGRHEPDLVDFYYGPPELERRVADEPRLEPQRLAAAAGELLAELDDRWLAAQVRALETVARTLAGEELPYAEEVELKYGIRPQWVDEREFERGHRLLDERPCPARGTSRLGSRGGSPTSPSPASSPGRRCARRSGSCASGRARRWASRTARSSSWRS
jgi:hypothetical protein